MILNLEMEKVVNSRKRLGVVGGYSRLCAMLNLVCLVCDLVFHLLHVLYSWRNSGVNEHGNGKVTLGELYCDHRQVPTDNLLACRISGLVALYLDCTTIRKEMEMVSRLLLTKTHTPDRHERLRHQNVRP
jgi:hypothetical protein